MKVLVIGPSETRSKGGMAAVIRGIQESRILNGEFEIDSFPSYIDGRLPARVLYSVYGYLRFLSCYKKYDLFHIHTAEKGSTFRKALYLRKVKKAGKKAIIHIHGAEYLPFYDGLGSLGKKIVDGFFAQADLVLALSDSWKRELESRFHMKACQTLYNGIDPSEFRPAATDAAMHRNSFLMLGRLGARKGAYDLIDAVELAALQNPKLTVCMAGDGEVEKIRALVAARGLQKHIVIPGWIDRKEKLRRLQEAATVVLPSYHEGLPMSILEGMAAGKAILSTAVGAVPEVVTEKNGILVEPGNIHALAKGLLRCSSDVGMLETMSRNNRKKAEAMFSTDRMHEQLAECYRQAAKRRKGTGG
ncbi:MAG: glycosyltransferase family 4 protein [Lachnospiraceae bacterium]|nr:glycosyltransferase family 4 protein [Lachnospiraceae bacterium]